MNYRPPLPPLTGDETRDQIAERAAYFRANPTPVISVDTGAETADDDDDYCGCSSCDPAAWDDDWAAR
jgi:hypothetical protein